MDEESVVEQEHNVYIDRAGKYRNMDLACSQVLDIHTHTHTHIPQHGLRLLPGTRHTHTHTHICVYRNMDLGCSQVLDTHIPQYALSLLPGVC